MRGDHLVDIPIACSLTAADMVDRGGAWDSLLRASLISSERVAGGLRVKVHPGAAQALRDLVDLERDCCPWIDFTFDDDVLVLTAAGAGEDLLVQMFSPDPIEIASGLGDYRD